MSSEKSYQNVRTVLFERDSDVRRTIKSTLNKDTFTQTVATSSLISAQAAIFNDEADLVVLDIDNDGNEIVGERLRDVYRLLTIRRYP